MRAAKGFVLAAGTASIVALGLFLPDMVSAVQDRSNDGAVSLFETSQVQLDTGDSGDVAYALGLLAQSSTVFDVSADTQMTADQAHAAVLDACAFFEERGLCSWPYLADATYETDTVLALSETEGRAAILWECSIYYGENEEAILTARVDDATGKLVSFAIMAPQDGVDAGEGGLRGNAAAWAQTAADYLGFGGTILEEGEGGMDAAEAVDVDGEGSTVSSVRSVGGDTVLEDRALIKLEGTEVILSVSYTTFTESTGYGARSEEYWQSDEGGTRVSRPWFTCAMRPVSSDR